LAQRLDAGATLLVKGSRGARMEQVIAALQERFAAAGTQPGRC
jgi:UDP-N-acetylmuramyl pentapeptide synthase